tara:strand:- start:268 stop:462 length:195 start_codon:yes stop_codon:yes gene_type:complete
MTTKNKFIKLSEIDEYVKQQTFIKKQINKTKNNNKKQKELLKSYGFSPIMRYMISSGIIKYSIS